MPDLGELSLVKVSKIEPLGGYRLRFHFSDATAGECDFSNLLDQSGPMIEPLKDPDYFRRVFIEFGRPTWPNGFDLALGFAQRNSWPPGICTAGKRFDYARCRSKRITT